MSKDSGQNPKKRHIVSDALTIARLCIATAAGQRDFNDTRQSWLARAARRLNFTPGRITSIWYGKGVRLSADELLQLMKERITEQGWQQARHKERLNDQANHIQALVGGNTPPLERGVEESERAGTTATETFTDAAVRTALPRE